jgi:DHA3 family macrolide efflux protein-like MFS transporter
MDDEPARWQAPFFTIWTGQSLSLIGSALVRFALIWWMTETTGSATVLAMASLVALLPPTVLGPVVGALVDRWRRRWVMVVADSAIALFTALLALLFWRETVQLWHVYAILSLRALGTAFHDPAMTASTTLMVPRTWFTRVAGMDQTRDAVNRIAGAPLGALLVTVLPIQAVLAIDVGTALLAVVPLLFIDVPQPAASTPAAREVGAIWRAVAREMGDGVRYLWRWRGLFVMLATAAAVPFFHQPTTSLRPLLITGHFGGGAAELGWATMAFGLGSVTGGLLMSTWGGFKRRMTTISAGVVLFGLANLLRGLAPAGAFWLYLGATFCAGPATAMYGAAMRAIMQATVPPEMQGRVFALRTSLFQAMAPLGLATLAPLGDTIGVQPIFLMDGVACLLVVVVWMALPGVRRVEDGPPAQVAGTTPAQAVAADGGDGGA